MLLRLAIVVSMSGAMPAAASPLEPHNSGAESYTETVTVIADLADGTYVQAQLAVSNLGMGDNKGACRVLVLPATGKPWTRAAQVDDDEWRFAAKPVPMLVVGTCQIMAGRKLVVDFRIEGAFLHLELDARARQVKPPGSTVGDPDDDFYTYELVVPWAPVSARVALPGQEPITSDGYGYADHSRSTMMPADLARLWVRFRGLGGECATLLLTRSPPEGNPDGWIWQPSSAEPLPIKPRVQLSKEAMGVVTIAAGGKSITITPKKKLYHHAPLKEYALGGLVRGWIGSPETTTYRAVLDDGSACRAVHGILEVTHVSR